jgi:large subunit ribosomal protein L3
MRTAIARAASSVCGTAERRWGWFGSGACRSSASGAASSASYATSARAVDALYRTANPYVVAKNAAKRRTGALAVKAGMTCDWDAHGVRLPLTVLWLDDVSVTQVKTAQTSPNGAYCALQVGYGSRKPKQVSKAELGHFVARGSAIKRALAEFRVSEDGVLPVGTKITAGHFTAGQYVDIQGVTKGKGFQGPMKRWGFAGQPASHGNTKKHRAHGSIGQCQDPGRVFKGKKMAGRMGGRNRTVQSVLVYKVDTERNLVYVKGQVPGNAGTMVKVNDSLRKPPKLGEEVPFPTADPETALGVFIAPAGPDPFVVDVTAAA